MFGTHIFGQRNVCDIDGSFVEVCDLHIMEALVSVRTDILYDCILGGEAGDYIRTNSDGTISVDLPIEGNLTLIVRDASLEEFLDHCETELAEADVPSDEIIG